jgi:hypothetical protein
MHDIERTTVRVDDLVRSVEPAKRPGKNHRDEARLELS